MPIIITNRGNEVPEDKPIQATPASAPVKPVAVNPNKGITEVVEFGDGWIAVKMADGTVMRRDGGTVAWRYNNEGNIKYGDFAKSCGAVGCGHASLSVFPTPEMGRAAKAKLLFTDIRGYADMPIIKAIRKYAPVEDNNDPEAYAHYIAKAAHVSYLKKLGDLTDDEKIKLLDAMKKFEGFKPGTVVAVKADK